MRDGKEAIAAGGDEVELVLKNPARAADHRLSCDAAVTTVAALQRLIQRDYAGNPDPATQTVRRKRG